MYILPLGLRLDYPTVGIVLNPLSSPLIWQLDDCLSDRFSLGISGIAAVLGLLDEIVHSLLVRTALFPIRERW